ncbi:hypothetical protein E2P81_ATG04885 [Venturia nashicola]|uniref:CsbD-like domain-containing protein n=1 Tax=Venturia nashicola TaxID=86259 RepID=A0A4Z1P4X9_9PEZI|nr:hypothetical protein E6O75_ATG05009 [Venturia nashicola]TLD34720.1 hypothetical protein E2P81_ATG04885 [Venturia nashicola]
MSAPQGSDSAKPGLVAAHAQYVKGQAVDAVGSITGSTEWKQSGHEQKEEAISNMKAASQDRDPSKDGYGKAEELAGKVAGCEGMVKEGAASAKKE